MTVLSIITDDDGIVTSIGTSHDCVYYRRIDCVDRIITYLMTDTVLICGVICRACEDYWYCCADNGHDDTFYNYSDYVFSQ